MTYTATAYLEEYYLNKANEAENKQILNFIGSSFPTTTFQSALDYGCGDSLMAEIMLSDRVTTFHMADVSLSALKILRQFKQQKGYLWEDYFEYAKEINIFSCPEELAHKLVRFIQSDIYLGLKEIGKYDLIISLFSLECAAETKEDCFEFYTKLLNHLRPGGKFIIGAMIGTNVWYVKRKLQPCAFIHAKDFVSFFRTAEIIRIPKQEDRGYQELILCRGTY